MKKKIIYIAHPIGGNIDANVKNILGIVKDLNMSGLPVVPFAPYIVDVLALDDNDPEQRARGFENNKQLFDFVDEVWLYGGWISHGMQTEIEWAKERNIPVLQMW